MGSAHATKVTITNPAQMTVRQLAGRAGRRFILLGRSARPQIHASTKGGTIFDNSRSLPCQIMAA